MTSNTYITLLILHYITLYYIVLQSDINYKKILIIRSIFESFSEN